MAKNEDVNSNVSDDDNDIDCEYAGEIMGELFMDNDLRDIILVAKVDGRK